MRIVYRYLRKEIFYSMISVTSIMVFIFVSNRLVQFLQFLAQGKYGTGFLVHLVLLQVPILFGLFLPLGLFLGILLSYGRMYADSEMVVLRACGMSWNTLLRMTMKIAFLVSLSVGILVFFINPSINQRQDKLLEMIRTKTVFQTIFPGQFQSSGDGEQIFYIKSMSSDRSRLNDVFIAQRSPSEDHNLFSWTILSAKNGYQKTDHQTQNHYMVAVNGSRYQGLPGNKTFEITQFHEYGFRLPVPDLSKYMVKARSLSSQDLLKTAFLNKNNMAELQWRISMPLTALILAFLAIPLSHVRPRHGQFARLWPAILIYIVYANILFVSRDWISKGTISPWLGIWWVHLSMLGIALWLFRRFNHEIN